MRLFYRIILISPNNDAIVCELTDKTETQNLQVKYSKQGWQVIIEEY